MNVPLQDLLSDNADDRLIEFEQDGYPIHVKFMRSPVKTNRLMISFHGASERNRGRTPFERTRNYKAVSKFAHQLTIIDPTIVRNESLSMGWYLGDREYPAQSVLQKFIARIIETLQAERVIFMGSSGGGFAALYFGFHHPGSIVLPIVAQTSLQKYQVNERRFFPRYCSICWPDLSEDEVAERVCVDVTKLYASKPFHNAVIYLMSPGDTRHFAHHATPFLSAVYGALDLKDINLSMTSDYWGVPGHGGAVPGAGFLPWLRAALTAPSIAQQDILDSYHTIKSQQARAAARKPAPTAKALTEGYAPQDLELAQTLQRYHLGATAGGH